MSENIEIDMVFTYVDGYDPELIKIKNNYMNIKNKKFNPSIRTRGLDEIIYSVNSVIKFIPWIRKIFIVTNNQIPPIDKQLISSGKVIIIDHSEIIDKQYLPTFNSDVIESFLHNIPDLSEIFLYNNDDMMHFNYVDRKDIYLVKNNKVLLKIRNKYNKNGPVYQNEYSLRMNYTKKLFLKIDPTMRLINNHHTKFLRKSTMKYIEGKFLKLLHKMRIHNVRGTGYIQYLFFLLNIDNILHNNIIISYGKDVIEKHLGNTKGNYLLLNSILQRKPKFLCLNSMNQSFKQILPKVMKEIL
jgi:hypothetical protein